MARSQQRSVPARFPSVLVTFPIIFGMVSGLTLAYLPESRTVPGMDFLYKVGLFLFRSDAGLKLGMNCAVLAHVLESFWTLAICRQHGLGTSDTLGWLGVTLLLGYGGIKELKADLQAPPASARGGRTRVRRT